MIHKYDMLLQVRVRRDGVAQSIPVADLVVGDLLLFEAGDILPADGVLLEGFDIRVDESNLTGTETSCTSLHICDLASQAPPRPSPHYTTWTPTSTTRCMQPHCLDNTPQALHAM